VDLKNGLIQQSMWASGDSLDSDANGLVFYIPRGTVVDDSSPSPFLVVESSTNFHIMRNNTASIQFVNTLSLKVTLYVYDYRIQRRRVVSNRV
jgi:hypothetical protein